ncbi:cytochrome d ubiquinol oxidase subunit II [Spiribacter insolitus]|uniref:Cytochrome d ubiquinol oxidase subunit II n=1 Tax=Spiribacter insolitus TaxID=3122417 RepID=A0ABV3TA26_9GAMM
METIWQFDLVHFWAAALAFSILMYVLLDGFDLGVGMLFGISGDAGLRDRMLRTIAPVWDGNETWLVVIGTVLFGAFPAVYAIFLSAFYLPVAFLLGALILRGVSMEFRGRSSVRRRWFWNLGFSGGSFAAAFVQGAAVGALVKGIDVESGQYVGGPWDWLSPFAVFCGLGLVAGYALLGASWLVMKTRDDLREWSYHWLLRLLAVSIVFIAISFVWTLLARLNITDRWFQAPMLLIVPTLLLIAGVGGLLWSWRQRLDRLAYPMAALIFFAAFIAFLLSFWPWVLPGDLRFDQAAAPPKSLEFLFYGAGMIVLPIVVLYTVGVYWIFRGKSRPLDE